MIDYVDVEVEGFKLRLPARLRQSKKLPLFKGRLKARQPSSAFLVVIAEALRAGAWKVPSSREWEGATWHYHLFGRSVTRPGGSEVSMTHVKPNSLGEVHNWTITFPIDGDWVYLNIMNGGGLPWDEFESAAVAIIRGVGPGTKDRGRDNASGGRRGPVD